MAKDQLFQQPLTGSEIPVPPEELVEEIGGGDFHAIGNDLFRSLQDLVGLRPDDAVLDVGCGCGRLAVPLTQYLDRQSSYRGFDVSATAIGWCRREITSRHPNFVFSVADLNSRRYNPQGKYSANEYVFPWEDNSFDVVALTSVFTHLLPNDLRHFLDEIVRVMAPRGRCLITFFLLNDETRELVRQGKCPEFSCELDGCWVSDREVPEDTVAYRESDVRRLFEERKLAITEPIHYGHWSGRKNAPNYQDIIVASLGD